MEPRRNTEPHCGQPHVEDTGVRAYSYGLLARWVCPHGRDFYQQLKSEPPRTRGYLSALSPKRNEPELALDQPCEKCGVVIEHGRTGVYCRACGLKRAAAAKERIAREDAKLPEMLKLPKVRGCSPCTQSSFGPCHGHGGPSAGHRHRLLASASKRNRNAARDRRRREAGLSRAVGA